MIATPDLINALADNLTSVRRLRPPAVRALCWLALVSIVLALLAISQGIRPDLWERLHQPTFVISMAGALLTGILAAIAAFVVSLPDRSGLWVLLPAPGLMAWLSTIGYQCLEDWVSIRPDGLTFGETARCFATLVLTGLPLSLAMLVMLRYVAPLRPRTVALAGSLAIAGLTAAALMLFHVLDATLMILMWNLGTTTLLVGLGGSLGRRLFAWVTPRSAFPLS